ncbi:MAG: hypothetical protein Q9M37_03850 [Desulfonauticus sp.]|nr:hypothetical protein [Desulfonauticus sp.]
MKEKKNYTLNQELEQVENQLLKFIQRRTKLLAKIASKRLEQTKPPVDTVLEKNLWNIWKQKIKGENQRFFRQLFSTLNNISYARAESKKQVDRPFCLYPRKEPLDFQTNAPLSLFQARVSIILAALSSTETHIEPFPLNDPLVELIKALNQVNAKISWQHNSLHAGPSDLLFEGRSIFLGEYKTTLYSILSLALTQAGSCRLNAAPALKILNLKDVQDLLPKLGARLSFIEPQTYNLPARLESSGQLPKEIVLPQNLDPLFGICLILAGIGYKKDITLIFSDLPPEIQELECILKQWKISVVFSKNTVHIPAQQIKSPLPLFLEADPLLSSYLLVLPYITTGRVKLLGRWSKHSLKAQFAQKLFKELGLNFHYTENSMETSLTSQNISEPHFDVGSSKDFFPLVLALAIAKKSKAIIYHQLEEGTDLEIGIELLKFLNFNYTLHPEYLEIEYQGEDRKDQKIWSSPSPLWTLSYGLISFAFKGIGLDNPASITQIWPTFWKIFQSLPQGKLETKPKESIDEPGKRRIRILGDKET